MAKDPNIKSDYFKQKPLFIDAYNEAYTANDLKEKLMKSGGKTEEEAINQVNKIWEKKRGVTPLSIPKPKEEPKDKPIYKVFPTDYYPPTPQELERVQTIDRARSNYLAKTPEQIQQENINLNNQLQTVTQSLENEKQSRVGSQPYIQELSKQQRSLQEQIRRGQIAEFIIQPNWANYNEIQKKFDNSNKTTQDIFRSDINEASDKFSSLVDSELDKLENNNGVPPYLKSREKDKAEIEKDKAWARGWSFDFQHYEPRYTGTYKGTLKYQYDPEGAKKAQETIMKNLGVKSGKYIDQVILSKINDRVNTYEERKEFEKEINKNQEVKDIFIEESKIQQEDFLYTKDGDKFFKEKANIQSVLKKDVEELQHSYQTKADIISEKYTVKFNELKTTKNQIQELYNNAQITETEANKLLFDNWNKIYNEYTSEIDILQKEADKQVDVLNENANVLLNDRFKNLFENWAKDQDISEEGKLKLKKIYDDTYKDVVSKRSKVLYDIESQDEIGTWTRHFKHGFGGWTTAMGYLVGGDVGNWMIRTGEDIVSGNPASPDLIESWSDWYKIPRVTAGLGGRMLPTVATTFAVAAATEGTGIPAWVSMGVVGLTEMVGEGADMAGAMKERVLSETGNMRVANEAASEVFIDNMKAAPLYYMGGLFYVGRAVNRLSRPLRIGARLGADVVQETTTELYQTPLEERIAKSAKRSAITGEEVSGEGWSEELTPEMAQTTIMTTVPTTMIIGGGPLAFEEASIINKEKKYLSDVINNESKDKLLTARNYIHQSVNDIGVGATRAWVAKLSQSLKLNNTQVQELANFINQSEQFIIDTKNTKLNGNQKNIYFRLINHARQLQKEANGITDENIKEKKLEEAKKAQENAKAFLNNPESGGSYVVMSWVENGSPMFITLTEEEAINIVSKTSRGKVIDLNDPNLKVLSNNALNFDEVFEKARQQQTEKAPLATEEQFNKATEIVNAAIENKEELTLDKLGEVMEALGENAPNIVDVSKVTTPENLLKTINDAVQEQTAGQVPVQSEATVSEEVAQGEPKAKPEVTAEEGVQEIKIDRPSIVSNTKAEVDTVVAATPETETGQTFNIDGTIYSDGGLAVPVVSENLTQEELTPERIANFVEANKDKVGANTVKVGIYKFPNSNQVSIDLNIVVPRNNRKAALEFARRAGQESLFDLDTFENVKTGSDGKNPMQFSSAQFVEIAKALEEGRMPEVFETVQQPTQISEPTITSETKQTTVDKTIKNTSEALSITFPNVKFIVGDTLEETRAKIVEELTPEYGAEKAQAAANNFTNVRGQTLFAGETPIAVVINKSVANNRTAGHEAWEIMLNDAFGKNPKKFEEFRNSIDRQLRLAGYEDIANELQKFSEQYVNGGNETMFREYMAEFGGMLVEGNFDIKNLTPNQKSLLQKIKDIINDFAMRIIGKEVFLKDATAENIIDFMSTISQKVAKGETVEEFFETKDTTKIENTDTVFKNRSQKIGDFDIYYFEDETEFQKLIDDGLVVQNASIEEAAGEPVAVHQPDNLFVGNLSYKGKKIMDGNGGVYYVLKFGNVWASGAKSSASGLVKLINESRAKSSDKKARLVLVRGSQDKMISSVQGVKAAMQILEELVFSGLISASDFRTALKAAGKKYNIDFSGTSSASSIKADIENKFMNVSDSTFEKRGTFFSDLVDELGKLESPKKNIKEIQKAIGSKKNIRFTKQGIREQLGTIMTERLLLGLPSSHAYAMIEVDEDVTFKEDKEHPSYPYAIVTKSGKPPVLKIFGYRPKAVEAIRRINGSPASNAQLGLAQRGMGIGRVATGEQITARAQKIDFTSDTKQQVEAEKLINDLKSQNKLEQIIGDRKAIEEAIKIHFGIPKRNTVSKEDLDIFQSWLKTRYMDDYMKSIPQDEFEKWEFAPQQVVDDLTKLGFKLEEIEDRYRLEKAVKLNDPYELEQINKERRKKTNDALLASAPKRVPISLNRVAELLFDTRYGAKELFTIAKMNSIIHHMQDLNGVSGAVKYRMEQASSIWKGLSKEEKDILNDMIFWMRVVEISKTREQQGKPKINFSGNTTAEYAQQQLDNLRYNQIELYRKLEDRSKKYFDTFRGLLKSAYESGLYTEEVYNELKDLNYSPILVINYLIQPENMTKEELDKFKDQINITSEVYESLMNESKAKGITTGTKNPIITDSEKLLGAAISRITDLIFKNELFNKIEQEIKSATPEQLNQIGEKIILNPITSIKDGKIKRKYDTTPVGMKEVFYKKDGVLQSMFIEESLYEQIVGISDRVDETSLNKVLKWISGTKVVKALATGINPLFAIVDIPVNIGHAALVSDVYGKSWTVNSASLGADMISGMISIKTQDQTFRDYILNGGGGEFMYNMGAIDTRKLNKPSSALVDDNVRGAKEAIAKAIEIYSSVGKYTEMGLRVGIYGRAFKQIMEKMPNNLSVEQQEQYRKDAIKEAIYKSRIIIDFSQGGKLTKQLESVLAYVNAANQAIYSYGSAVKQRPIETVSKTVEASALMAAMPIGLSLALIAANKGDDDDRSAIEVYWDAINRITQDTKSKYAVIITGNKDKDGEYIYYKLKKNPTLAATTDLMSYFIDQMLMSNYGLKESKYKSDRDSIDRIILRDLQKELTLVGVDLDAIIKDRDLRALASIGSRNPTVVAAMAYFGGWDLYYNKPLDYKMGEIPKEREGYSDPNVENFYINFGNLTGSSPTRTKKMLEAYVTNPQSNPAIAVVYALAEYSFGGEVKSEKLGLTRDVKPFSWERNLVGRFRAVTNSPAMEKSKTYDIRSKAAQIKMKESSVLGELSSLTKKVRNEEISVEEANKILDKSGFTEDEKRRYKSKLNYLIKNNDPYYFQNTDIVKATTEEALKQYLELYYPDIKKVTDEEVRLLHSRKELDSADMKRYRDIIEEYFGN